MPLLPRPINVLLALLLSTGSGLALAASVAEEPDSGGTFHYTVQPGDSAWNITARYLRTTEHWQALRQRHHLQGDRLQPGQVLDIPMNWLKLATPQATLVGLAGEVQLKQGKGGWQPARANTVLPPDTWLRTRAGSTATLVLQDGTRVNVQPDSELRLMPLDQADLTRWLKARPPSTPAANAPVRIELLHGGLENAVQPQPGGNRFEVHTPSAVTTVRGTEFRVFADAQSSRAEVVHGAVGFHNPRGQVELGMATGSRAERGVSPIAAVPLLPAPDVAAVPDTLAPAQARQVSLPTVAGATAYRVQWLTADTPGRLLHDAVSATSQPGYPELPEGTYRWRVRAIDAQGFEGLSAERTLTLVAAPPPSPQPPGLHAVRVGQRLELRWAPTDTQASFQVQMARDASFSGTVVLDEPTPHTHLSLPLPPPAVTYHARIRALHPGGNFGPWSAPHLIDPRSLQEPSP